MSLCIIANDENLNNFVFLSRKIVSRMQFIIYKQSVWLRFTVFMNRYNNYK